MTKPYGSFFVTQVYLQTLLQVAVIQIRLHVDCQRPGSEHLLPRQNHQVPRLLQRQRPSLRYPLKQFQPLNLHCLHRPYLLNLMDEDITSERQKELIRQASSIEHKLTHMLKNPCREVCQRSRMYKQRVTKKHLDPLADRGGLPPTTQFGERIATDYIIPPKKDPAVHVIRDEYSGAIRVFVGARAADKAAQNLLTFVGARYKELPSVLCKSDDAKELIAAVTQIGWVHEGSLENRFPHNAQLEREIRTL